MTGLTVAQFDRFFTNHYYVLQKEADKYDSDLLHDVYLKLREKITGITITSNVIGYFKKSIKNAWLNSITKQPITVDIDQLDQLENLDDFTNNQEYYNQLENYTRYLFRFVEQRYTEKQQHVYKSYYMTDKATYRDIADRTGYSYSTVEQYVQKINRDIKQNFESWLKKETKKRLRVLE